MTGLNSLVVAAAAVALWAARILLLGDSLTAAVAAVELVA